MKKLSTREVVMLVCLGVVMALAGYYVFVFQPLQLKLTQSMTELDETTVLLDSARAKESEGLEVRKNLTTNEVVWNSINSKLPEGFMDTDIIDMMAAARTKHGIENRLLYYRFGTVTPVRENILSMIDVEVEVTAEYDTVMKFIETFTENEKMVCRIINFSSSVSKDDGVPLNKMVNASFRMQILYRIPAEERAAAEAAAAA